MVSEETEQGVQVSGVWSEQWLLWSPSLAQLDPIQLWLAVPNVESGESLGGEIPNKWGTVAIQLDEEFDVKRVELRTERNLSMTLRNGEKDRQLKRVQDVPCLCFSLLLKLPEESFNPTIATKTINKQNSTE